MFGRFYGAYRASFSGWRGRNQRKTPPNAAEARYERLASQPARRPRDTIYRAGSKTAATTIVVQNWTRNLATLAR
jgi:hypothetical protein